VLLARTTSLRHVLGVIVDGDDEIRRTFSTAVRLASDGHARLSLVKTCDASAVFASVGPLGAHVTLAPPDDAAREDANRLLTRLAGSVPDHIPLTIAVLGPKTQTSLCRLLLAGVHDAMVAPVNLVATCPKLTDVIAEQRIQLFAVSGLEPPALREMATKRRVHSTSTRSPTDLRHRHEC
jgi:hypothetical protein